MNKEKKSPLYRLSATLVDRRKLLFFLYFLAVIFSLFSRSWVVVENDLTAYLDENTETRQGVSIMEEEFVTLATADIMLSNITFAQADSFAQRLKDMPAVASVAFDETADHYKHAAALLSVSFSGVDTDEDVLETMAEIRVLSADYDASISTTIGENYADSLAAEMQVIIAIAGVIIVSVVLFTSKSYAEIPVLLLTFCTAAILNMGTNYLLGTISFVSNSVAVVLQLALAIDYAIIFCHRFTEERKHLDTREACIEALSKAIPEIFSSSLTTISGLAALAFMHFGIGADLSIVLIKSIALSLLCVFTLMPGLLMVFSRAMDKTQHKNFVPSIAVVGRFSIKTRYIIPPIFLIVVFCAFHYANLCPYLFGNSDLRAIQRNESQIATDRIHENFGSTNMLALIVPSGDYESERNLLLTLEQYDEVDSTQGLSNTKAIEDYYITDALTARQFSELVNLDYELVKLLYSAYAVQDQDYAKVLTNSQDYALPLLDMFKFLYGELQAGYVQLDKETMEGLDALHRQLTDAERQLQSESYSRMLVFLNLPEESEETFAFLHTIKREASRYYPDDVHVVGLSTSDADLSSTFKEDNLLIGILSAFFVIVILIFTFQSVGMPVLLIIVIQAAIWINFSFPYLQGEGLFFMGYLVVSSIQMGANIDYAIVITSRYMDLKKTLRPREAIVQAVDMAFPTILTSGVILAASGIIIQCVTTDGIIASIGACLGRGTIISMVLVLFVLPQILYLGDIIIEKTSFSVNLPEKTLLEKQGKLLLQGRVRGYVCGTIDAQVKGTLTGEIAALLEHDTQIEHHPLSLGASTEQEASSDEDSNA